MQLIVRVALRWDASLTPAPFCYMTFIGIMTVVIPKSK
jgi:hypothetical protein